MKVRTWLTQSLICAITGWRFFFARATGCRATRCDPSVRCPRASYCDLDPHVEMVLDRPRPVKMDLSIDCSELQSSPSPSSVDVFEAGYPDGWRAYGNPEIPSNFFRRRHEKSTGCSSELSGVRKPVRSPSKHAFSRLPSEYFRCGWSFSDVNVSVRGGVPGWLQLSRFPKLELKSSDVWSVMSLQRATSIRRSVWRDSALKPVILRTSPPDPIIRSSSA